MLAGLDGSGIDSEMSGNGGKDTARPIREQEIRRLADKLQEAVYRASAKLTLSRKAFAFSLSLIPKAAYFGALTTSLRRRGRMSCSLADLM